MIVEGNLVDIHQKSIYPARITLEGERIQSIQPLNATNNSQYILPGFIDAHIHI